MKKLALLLFFLPVFANAQDAHLRVQGSAGNLYLTHKTAPKENYYSIGRIYNISPKEVAPYNKLVLENGLSLGQEIRIPLKENFTQTNDLASDEAAIPLYHKTGSKETLSSISRQYNNISPASLKSWNKLKTDALSPGQDIVIGYLKVKKSVSPLSSTAAVIAAPEEPTKEVEVKTKTEVPTATVKTVTAPAKTPEVKKPEVKETVVVKTAEPERTKVTVASGDKKEGVFKSSYVSTGKEENGKAGLFKSTSGWEDGKYYCLHNAAPQGAVIKITNAATGRSVYAKVLDVMPDLKQNNGMVLRISNAAADALGAGANEFDCSISY